MLYLQDTVSIIDVKNLLLRIDWQKNHKKGIDFFVVFAIVCALIAKFYKFNHK